MMARSQQQRLPRQSIATQPEQDAHYHSSVAVVGHRPSISEGKTEL